MDRKGIKTKLKKAAVVAAALLLLLSACAPKNANNASENNSSANNQENNVNPAPSNNAVEPGGNSADPDEGLTREQKLYKDLKALCEAAVGTGEGELTLEKQYTSSTSFPGGGVAMDYTGNDVFKTSYYTDSEGRVEYVRLIDHDGSGTSTGELQYEGILYKYTLVEHEDGSREWVEGVAEADCTGLPAIEALLYELPEFEDIESIKLEYSTYTLVFKSSFNRMMNEDRSISAAMYSVGNVRAEYYVDESGKLSGCLWTFTENWNDGQSTTSSDVSAEVSVADGREAMPATWFRDNTTYVRPEYTDVTEIAREAHYNIPGKIIFDVRIPRVKENLPGAAGINARIKQDFAYELDMYEPDLRAQTFDYYVTHTADFEVVRLGNVYEIIIYSSEGSAAGSGMNMRSSCYFYDAAAGAELSAEAMLQKMGYTQESFMEAADADEDFSMMYGQKLSEVYSYEELLSMFYFDSDSVLRFSPEMWF